MANTLFIGYVQYMTQWTECENLPYWNIYIKYVLFYFLTFFYSFQTTKTVIISIYYYYLLDE